MAVAFYAAGTGGTNDGSSLVRARGSHNAGGADRIVFVVAKTAGMLQYGSGTQADYAGVPMTLLRSASASAGAYFATLYLFALKDPPTGLQEVSVRHDFGIYPGSVTFQSVSYMNVARVGDVYSVTGSGTSFSQTVPAALGELVVQAFGGGDTTAIEGYSRVERARFAGTQPNAAVVVGDGMGAPSINFSAVASGPANMGWEGLAVRLTSSDSGSVKPDPVLTTFTTPGSFTYQIPEWASHIDVVLVGGGGGGRGAGWIVNGAGGEGGTWAWRTIERGIDIPRSQTTLTGTVGAGGAAGSGGVSPGDGGNGVATTVAGLPWASGAGGTGGRDREIVDRDGQPAKGGNANGGKDVVFNGYTYVGGGSETPPGGGGKGGGASPFSGNPGYPGARGQAWFVARKLTEDYVVTADLPMHVRSTQLTRRGQNAVSAAMFAAGVNTAGRQGRFVGAALDVAAEVSSAGIRGALADTALAVLAALSSAGVRGAIGGAALGVEASVLSRPVADLVSSADLVVRLAPVVAAGQGHSAKASLAVALAAVLRALIPTRPLYIAGVGAENRVVAVVVEDRAAGVAHVALVSRVPAEIRFATVPLEGRSAGVAAEARSVVVPAELRSVVVPAALRPVVVPAVPRPGVGGS